MSNGSRCSLPLRLAVMMLLTMMCAGCGTLNPAALQAPAKQAINLSRDCENLAKDPDIPQPVKGQSRKLLLMRTRQALVKAADSIADTRECQQRQRLRLAKGAGR